MTVEKKTVRTLSSDDTKNELIINIIDNGSGTHPYIQPRLFSKFVTTSANGSGLGLYFSKKIIKAHGGQISAKNRDDDRGAIFSLSLPIRYEITQ